VKRALIYILVIAMVGLVAVSRFPLAQKPTVQDYSDPQIPVGKYDELVSVDVVRSGDDVWVLDHQSGHLVFELSGKKKVDETGFRIFKDLLNEAAGDEAGAESHFGARATPRNVSR